MDQKRFSQIGKGNTIAGAVAVLLYEKLRGLIKYIEDEETFKKKKKRTYGLKDDGRIPSFHL
jgi:hypothetical protein